MPIPTDLSDLDTVAANNYPVSTETLSTADDYFRAHASILKKISTGANALTTPALGTPASGTLTNCTGLPPAGVTGTALVASAIGTTVQAYDADLTTWAGITPAANVGAFLATPSSANLIAAMTDETGTGACVFANTPTLVTPVLGTPTSGNLSNCTADGTDQVGFKNVPQDAQSGATYTLALTDGGKHVYITSTCTVTIPTNASVAFPIGATITIINNASAVTTFTTTSLTVYKAGVSAAWASGGTLSIRGMCTWIKVATDTWFVNGATLS